MTAFEWQWQAPGFEQTLASVLIEGDIRGTNAWSETIQEIRKNCTTCVQFDPTIKEGYVLLSTANVGDAQHYSCCGSERKGFLRVVFVAQDKRDADFFAKESGTSAEKKAKLEEEEAAVDFATLVPDSDDEL